MTGFSVPIHVHERHGIARKAAAIRVGVPLPKGLLRSVGGVQLQRTDGTVLAHQLRTVARWGDGSLKWLLLDTQTDMAANVRETLQLVPVGDATEGPGDADPVHSADAIAFRAPPGHPTVRVQAQEASGRVCADTGAATFEFHAGAMFLRMRPTGVNADVDAGDRAGNGNGNGNGMGSGDADVSGNTTEVRLLFTSRRGDTVAVEFGPPEITEQGALRTVVIGKGTLQVARPKPALEFEYSAVVHAGAASAELDIRVWNPDAAVHPGGLWDLGDPGSVLFRDLTLEVLTAPDNATLHWQAEVGATVHADPSPSWCLHQNSSGGEQWDSPNHVDRDGRPGVRFRGYRVLYEADGDAVSEGLRAEPVAALKANTYYTAIGLRDFWQNFPKSLRRDGKGLAFGLFPREAQSQFELQGGESKRHTLVIACGNGEPEVSAARGALHPPVAFVAPEWTQAAAVLPWFAVLTSQDDRPYLDYVNGIIEGADSFTAKREVVDEYGWRNFGDLYADHEAVRHTGSQPFVSHYNNQYDFIFGACQFFLRSGDARWFSLLRDAARHMMDIDVYRTGRDRPAYNGGMFWHSDHYMPAATCTHRTYSKANGGRGYGGGPSCEHNYTSGLLHYYYLTGDSLAAQTVKGLADWVVAMEDGTGNVLSLLDESATGLATAGTSGAAPGRGAGNSINALLDAWTLTGEHRYKALAETLITRCIHPEHDVAGFGLEEPEYTWTYLAFLQVLARYLELKLELGERDYHFHYARESLLNYARWIAGNEVPYRDVLHKVEIPTETWPAQDIRKCHVLHVAARHSHGEERARFRQKAEWFFTRCLGDLLDFPTARLTRPMVILCVFGGVHGYFMQHDAVLDYPAGHAYRFGRPEQFVPQRAKLGAALRRKMRLASRTVAHVGRQLAYRLLPRR